LSCSTLNKGTPSDVVGSNPNGFVAVMVLLLLVLAMVGIAAAAAPTEFFPTLPDAVEEDEQEGSAVAGFGEDELLEDMLLVAADLLMLLSL